MINTLRLKAAEPRRCDGCGKRIPTGADYLVNVMSPLHVDPETAEQIGTGKIERRRECETCARRNGRGHHLDELEAPA